MAKDSERLLRKTKKRKIKENISSDESFGVYKSPSKFEKRPIIPKGKDDKMLLGKGNDRKTKIKKTAKSIGYCESPFEFEKGLKTQKGNDGEKVLIKAKNRMIKDNRTFDKLIGACESPSEFEQGLKTHKLAKDGERLLDKAKKRKMKEKKAFDESIGVYKSSPEFQKRPKTRKGKDDGKLFVKTKKRKIKTSGTFDESTGAFESLFDIEKGPKIPIGKDDERPLVKAKKRKIKEDRTHNETIGACESPKFEMGPETEIGRRSAKVDSWESSVHLEALNEVDSFIQLEATVNELKTRPRKLKKKCKHKKKHLTNAQKSNNEVVQRVFDEEKVDEISSGDDDCTRGMKKWLTQYKESRPGLEVLQQRIDQFVMAHEERLEQERKEREARAAEDGWTVVVHHKGRKKTTDAETGTTVGSVASAAVLDKMSKKPSKEIALDFYRFQKREAKRNELMMLQSKFEQDKKRIQQLRAARKFRPS